MNNGTTPTGCTLGLIGRPLGHSYSKVFFDTLFERENRSESYGLFELPELTPVHLVADESLPAWLQCHRSL